MKYLIFILLITTVLTTILNGQTVSSENSKFKISFSERFRIETWDNTISLSSQANAGTSYNRNLTNLMFQWTPNKQFEAALMLANENRYYFTPTSKNFNIHEVFFDQLYLKYTNKFGLITLGRQNIMLGEGFIVMDGTPLDGSRSSYFNAGNLEFQINKTNKLNSFLTYVPDIDNILPIINDQNQKLVEQPELGAGLYGNCQTDKFNIQPYYIYKHIYATDKLPTKSDIHTTGTRATINIKDKFSFTAEAAYQFGSYGDTNRSAFGGYAYFDYMSKLNKPYIPDITLGGIYLSGNKSSSENINGWDPVFSRWPKWSESYIYTLINENGGKPAYWSNLASIYGKLKFALMNELTFFIDYHHLFAPQNDYAAAYLGGTGKTRGDLIIAKLLYKINSNLTGYILWESFIPGNYYSSGASKYNWARVELKFKI
jgi:hypothetical protein